VRWTDLEAVDAAVRTADGPLRLSPGEAAALLAAPGAREDRPAVELRGWLGVPLTSLGGEALGALHLVNRLEGEFTALDEAVAVHLAQMAARRSSGPSCTPRGTDRRRARGRSPGPPQG
jgi:GAF domain-containing protein